jgi:hypothetical protein
LNDCRSVRDTFSVPELDRLNNIDLQKWKHFERVMSIALNKFGSGYTWDISTKG